MITSTLRGAAVLAFLILLPRATAVPLTLLSANRSVTISGYNPTSSYSDQAQTSGFGLFDSTVGRSVPGAGSSVRQTSNITPDTITFSGYVSTGSGGSAQPGNYYAFGSSLFAVSFSVPVDTAFVWSGTRNNESLYANDYFSLASSLGTLNATWPFDPLTWHSVMGTVNGTLQAGVVYTLSLDVYDAHAQTASAFDGGLNRYDVAFAVVPAVPDTGSSAALLAGALGLLFLGYIHNNNRQ